MNVGQCRSPSLGISLADLSDQRVGHGLTSCAGRKCRGLAFVDLETVGDSDSVFLKFLLGCKNRPTYFLSTKQLVQTWVSVMSIKWAHDGVEMNRSSFSCSVYHVPLSASDVLINRSSSPAAFSFGV